MLEMNQIRLIKFFKWILLLNNVYLRVQGGVVMNYCAKLFLLLLFISPLLAFDNEIIVKGKVIDGVSFDILMLSEKRGNLFLYTNSKTGAKITVKELGSSGKNNKTILNNGLEYPLPLIYELFDSSSFLGTSPLPLESIILGVDISIH